MKHATSILLALACALVYPRVARAECCRATLTLSYFAKGYSCSSTGGYNHGIYCMITICADGKPRVGTYCGRGSCDIFGCNCARGCITGNWKKSFLDNHSDVNIVVMSEDW